MSQKPRAKNWAITVNNPDGDFCLKFDPKTDQYLLCGEEVGDVGTAHIQGYVQLKKQTLLTTLKKRWPRAHLEIAKGSPKQNYDYCTKEGKSHEHGEMLKGQGARSDLNEVKRIIDQGGNIGDVRESSYSSFIRYQRAIIADVEYRRPDRAVTTEMVIYWGVTGSGKSHRAITEFPEAYWKTRGEWWDGYDGHETVIIDEFYGWISIDFMLRVADKYPLQVPIKGGFRKFVAKRVIITSNRHWNFWWPNVTNQAVWDAFERRITRCEEFTEPWKPVGE